MRKEAGARKEVASSVTSSDANPQRKKRWRDKLAATRTKPTGLKTGHYIGKISKALEDAGGAHAAADAHGDHAIAGVFALEFADDGGGEFCAGAAEGVAKGDGAAVGIDARGVKAGLRDDREGLRGKGFIELDDGHVAEGEAGELQCFGDCPDRADAELFGENAGGGVSDEARERF